MLMICSLFDVSLEDILFGVNDPVKKIVQCLSTASAHNDSASDIVAVFAKEVTDD